MPKVRTTIQPDVELEVDEAEALDLERQGLLVGGRTARDRKAEAKRLTKEASEGQ